MSGTDGGGEEQERYQTSPERATGLGANVVNLSSALKRKDVLIVICIGFAVLVMIGLVFSATKAKKKNTVNETASGAARTPDDFLRRERDRERNQGGGGEAETDEAAAPAAFDQAGIEAAAAVSDGQQPGGARQTAGRNGLPEVSVYREGGGSQQQTSPPPAPQRGGGGAAPPFTAHKAPLVPPVIEGSIFGAARGAAQSSQPAAPASGAQSIAERYPYTAYAPQQSPYAAYAPQPAPAQNPYSAAAYSAASPYAMQNDQSGKQSFYNAAGAAAGGGSLSSGQFLGDNSLWIGTIIPAVLETAVNTDLPGNVIARVTQNVYDSRTGGSLLIPQGTLLTARYNSSVSYAQHRIQIVWDALTRPDGYHVELGGMNAVDAQGMSGTAAQYNENWFEYLKAAGIIAMFSLANSTMAQEAAKYGTQEMAAAVVQSNAELMNQLGGSIVSRAMDIQPTLTLQAGQEINVMINRNMFLPPVSNYPVTQRYILK